MTFRSQIGPLIKSYECYVFAKFQIGNHIGLMDSWKALIVFFFQFYLTPPPLKHTNPTHTPHIHIIKSWPDILTIFTVFTQYRFESLWAYVIDLTH